MTTCPSCGIAGNNFSCPNHISYWGVNPSLDLVPPPQTSVNWINSTSAQLFAEIGRLNVLLNKREEEIAVLKQTSADLCPECGWRFLVPGIGCQGCERARLEDENEELTECLRWYVENDDTNEGGKWEDDNGFWLRGKRRAMQALGMEEE